MKPAKDMAIELAVRLSSMNQREIGKHYGGIGSSAVAMARRKLVGDEKERLRLERPLQQLEFA